MDRGLGGMRFRQVSVLVWMALGLSACGGGGNGNVKPAAPYTPPGPGYSPPTAPGSGGTTPPTTVAQIPTTVDLGLVDGSGQPAIVIDNAPVLQVSNAMMDALGFGGILGGNVMRQFPVQLDYSAPMMEGFCLGCTASTTRTDVQQPSRLGDLHDGAPRRTLHGAHRRQPDLRQRDDEHDRRESWILWDVD